MLKKNTTLKKHYKVLELSEGAELTEIKASYKKLALQFHPDKNPDGLEKFKKINEAYQILSKALQPASEPTPNASGTAPKPRRKTAADEAQEELDEELFRMYQSYMEAMRQQEEERLAKTSELFNKYQNTKITWVVFAAMWLSVLTLNYLFNINFDWWILTALSFVSLLLKFQKAPILALHGFYPSNIRIGSLVLFVANVLIFELFVIYFAAPNAVLYRGANIAFITFSVMLINIFKIQFDVSVALWLALIALEFVFRTVPENTVFLMLSEQARNNATNPGLIAAHCVTCALTMHHAWSAYYRHIGHVIPSGSARALDLVLMLQRFVFKLEAVANSLAEKIHFRIEAVFPLILWPIFWALKALIGVNIEWILSFFIHAALILEFLWSRRTKAFWLYLALRSVPSVIIDLVFPYKWTHVETVSAFLLHLTVSSIFMSREYRLQWSSTKEQPKLWVILIKHAVTFFVSLEIERKLVPLTTTPQWNYLGIQSFLDAVLGLGYPILSGLYNTPPPLDDDSDDESSDEDSSEDEESNQQAQFQQFRQHFYQNFGPMIANARPRDPMERARQKKTQRQAAKMAKSKAQTEMNAANKRNKRR
jgi:hypothetical protein